MGIHYATRSRALHDAWAGDRKKLDEIYASPDYSRKEKMALHKASLMPPLVYETKGMSYDDMVRVYNAATPEQKEQLRIPMVKKFHNMQKAGKMTKEEPED